MTSPHLIAKWARASRVKTGAPEGAIVCAAAVKSTGTDAWHGVLAPEGAGRAGAGGPDGAR